MQREGYILSGLLHGGVFLMLWLGLPFFFQAPLLPPQPISVELVSEETLREAADAADAKKEAKADDQPKMTPPSPIKKPEAKPQEVATAQPVDTQEELVAVEKDILSLLDDDVLEKLNEPVKAEAPKPITPPKPKPKPKTVAQKKPDKKKTSMAFDSLLNNVTEKKPKPQPVSHTSGKGSVTEEDITKILSPSELDGLRRQVASCWNVPAGARDASDLVVDVHVELSPQGHVNIAKVTGGNQAHPYFRTGAESAVRALKNPRCNPLKIPPHRMAQMQSFTFRFNPRYMF